MNSPLPVTKEKEPQCLLILTPGFANDETDTACLVSQQNLVRSINKLFPRLEIFIVALQYPYRTQPYQWYGNTVIPLNGQNKGGLQRRLLWLKARRQLKKIYRKKNVSGILSFWCGECALLGKSFAAKYRLPHFCWVLGQDAKAGNEYAARMKDTPGQLVAISDFVATQLKNNYGIQAGHVIPNAIEPALFNIEKPAMEIDIIGVGSLIPLKRYDLFTDLILQIKKTNPSIHVMVCGDGPEKETLIKKAASLGLEDTIRFTGEQKHSVVLQLLQRSRLLLHPSAYEGFPTVCLEALYAGCKVVSCIQPMQIPIPGWEVAKDIAGMQYEALAALNDPSDTIFPEYYHMDHAAASFIKLLGIDS